MSTLCDVAPQALMLNPWNTNEVSPENEAKIEASMRRNPMFKPIIARELDDGTLQVLGGAHRRDVAIRIGLATVPVFNLGRITDQQAKEIGLADNARYGADNTLALAALLDELGTPQDIASFLPYTDTDFASIFAGSTIALDDLDLLPEDDDAAPSAPVPKAVRTHAIMRFKVPVGDVAAITEKIERTMKQQRLNDEDSLTNAGNALVHIFNDIED